MNGHDDPQEFDPTDDEREYLGTQDDEELTLAIILERDYKRREAQLREWWRRWDEQRAAYKAFEAETLAMIDEMKWGIEATQ